MNAPLPAPDPTLLAALDPGSPWSRVCEQARLQVAILAADFSFLRVSTAFAAADGKTPDDYLGRRYFDLHPNPEVEAVFRAVAASGRPFAAQAQAFARNPSPRRGTGAWSWTLTPIAGPGPSAGCLVLTMRDVGAEIRAVERARLGENNARNLLHDLPAMVYRGRPDWSTEILLNAWELCGFEPEEIDELPGRWLDLVHPDDRPALRAADEALRAGPGRQTLSYRIRHRCGEWITVEDHKGSLFDDSGRFLGVEGLVIDVSDRLPSDAGRQDLLETTTDGFWQIGSDGQLVEVNGAYCRMSGYSRSELLAMRIADLDADEDPATAADHLARVIKGGNDRFVTRHRRKDGSLWNVEVSTSWSPRARHVFAFLRDIDEAKRTEALLATRLELSELGQKGDIDRLLQATLDAAERLTDSRIGFFHFVDDDQQHLSLQMWSSNTLATMCTAEGKGAHYAIDRAGVWVDCVARRQPVIHNDYAALPHRRGLPEGHAPVVRELTVPVIDQGKVTAIIGVGNKRIDYDERDVGVVTELASMAMDIVQRMRAAARLDESESRMRSLFNSMTSGFALHEIILDDAGKPCNYRLLEVNPAFEAITGMQAADLVGHTILDVLPDTEAVWIERYGQVATSGDPIQFEEYSGDLGRHYRISAYCPTPGQFATIIDDITLIKKHEEELRQASAVFEHTRDGVVIADLDANIVAVNKAYTTITGYEADEVLGRNPSLLKSGRHDQEFYRAMWAELLETDFWQGEIWNRRKNGEIYPEWLSLSTVRDVDGNIERYIGVFTDISRVKAAEERLEYMSWHDALTGLPNRTLLNLRYPNAIQRAQRRDRKVALLVLDLDLFKNINDTLGHNVGDELLVAIAERFGDRLRGEDTLARLGGDEFAVLMEDIGEANDAAILARALLEALESPFSVGSGNEIYIGASIGISVSPDDGVDPTVLMRNADAAVYQAKAQGRKTFRFYTESLTSAAVERMTVESRLRKAIEQGHLVLHYQPLIATSGAVIGSEALVRWNDPVEGLISPMRFIPVAEDSGLIAPLGAWVLAEACRQMKAWLDDGHKLWTIAVNLSPRQFVLQDVPELVRQSLAASGLEPRYLELEITEGTLMENAAGAITMLQRLRDIGVRLSVDDFGTGYSSLSYLKRFPIDKLKIDQSFVRDIDSDPDDAAIASTVIAMARSLRLSVLAEGVETESQLAFLEQHGCDYYQGYLFSKPVPAEKFPFVCTRTSP